MNLWIFWLNLTKKRRKRKHFRDAVKGTEKKMWEQEFLKHQFWEVKAGEREQFDWLRERVDGAIRRKAELKYNIFHETKEPINVKDLPLPPREIELLPNKPTKPHRFYKEEKGFKDMKEATETVRAIEELDRIIKSRQPDLDQKQQQLEKLNMKVQEIDQGIHGLHDLKSSLLSLLRKL